MAGPLSAGGEAMTAGEPAKILVVDDLAAQRLATVAVLAEIGEPVVAVDSGAAALRRLLEDEFAVVLLDVNMPEMDGFETAALIRQRGRSRQTPIIFLTADPDELRAAQGYSLGAVDYIVCPFVPDVLRAKVRVFVELSRAREQRVALSRAEAAREAAEEESHRLRVLADASGVLARSLDAATLVADLLPLLVPALGDAAATALCDGAGGAPKTSWLSVDAAGPPQPTALAPAERGELDAGLAQVFAGAAESLIADGVGPPRGAVLPLFAGGRLLGAIAVDATRSGRRLSTADLELFRLLASRTAIALDNCRLYGEIQDRDRQKDAFLAMLSHELRNPLGAIAMAVRVLDAVGSADQRAAGAREVVRRQSAHLTRMVDDLLDVARVASGRIGLTLVPLRLDEVIERVLTDLRAAGRLERHALEVRAVPVLVNGDNTRLEQVVTNLLLNALKYTEPGGRIDVEVAEAEGEAVLRVRDSGIGISADLLPRVFDLFAQGRQTLARAQGGLGIGLTLVRLLVEQQGGRVEACSDGPGRGSLFTVWLPRLRLAAETAETGESPAPDRGVAALRILVVEDNDDARGMLRTLLELNGHEVHEACDGEEGLAQALRLMPQVAFIDLGLPGADGLAVAAAIRQTGPGERMVLVALTGYGQATDRRKTREAGFDEHLVKPVELDRVTEVLALARGSRDHLRPRSHPE